LRYCVSGGVCAERDPLSIFRVAGVPILLQDGVDEALQALELALVRTFEFQVDAIGIGANDFR